MYYLNSSSKSIIQTQTGLTVSKPSDLILLLCDTFLRVLSDHLIDQVHRFPIINEGYSKQLFSNYSNIIEVKSDYTYIRHVLFGLSPVFVQFVGTAKRSCASQSSGSVRKDHRTSKSCHCISAR